MQHTQSRFLKVAKPAELHHAHPAFSRFMAEHPRISRFIAEHPKVSRFIANHLPKLCPFLPMPGAAPAYNARSLKPKPSRFAP